MQGAGEEDVKRYSPEQKEVVLKEKASTSVTEEVTKMAILIIPSLTVDQAAQQTRGLYT
jgi:hypothetical protein